MSATATPYSHHPFERVARRELVGPARASHHLAPTHLAEQAYTAELVHAERSARVRDRDALLAHGSGQ